MAELKQPEDEDDEAELEDVHVEDLPPAAGSLRGLAEGPPLPLVITLSIITIISLRMPTC